MKASFLTILIFTASFCFGQEKKNQKEAYSQKASHGYVENIRLDSIDSKYAEIELRAVGLKGTFRLLFKYGQEYSSTSQLLVKSESQVLYQFESLIAVLNFLDFNNWSYLDSITKPDYQIILVRKK